MFWTFLYGQLFILDKNQFPVFPVTVTCKQNWQREVRCCSWREFFSRKAFPLLYYYIFILPFPLLLWGNPDCKILTGPRSLRCLLGREGIWTWTLPSPRQTCFPQHHTETQTHYLLAYLPILNIQILYDPPVASSKMITLMCLIVLGFLLEKLG